MRQKRSLIGILLLILWLSTGLTGCAKDRVVLHPLQDDFKFLKAGEDFKAPKQGAFVSDYWLNKVAEVEVELV